MELSFSYAKRDGVKCRSKNLCKSNHPEHQDSLGNFPWQNDELAESVWILYDKRIPDQIIFMVDHLNESAQHQLGGLGLQGNAGTTFALHDISEQSGIKVFEVHVPVGGHVLPVCTEFQCQFPMFLGKHRLQLVDSLLIPFHKQHYRFVFVFKMPKVGVEPTRLLGTRF